MAMPSESPDLPPLKTVGASDVPLARGIADRQVLDLGDRGSRPKRTTAADPDVRLKCVDGGTGLWRRLFSFTRLGWEAGVGRG